VIRLHFRQLHQKNIATKPKKKPKKKKYIATTSFEFDSLFEICDGDLVRYNSARRKERKKEREA
jgi:hypothetical protein